MMQKSRRVIHSRYNEAMWEKDIAPMVLGIGICVVLPVVALLLSHQRKMAELFRQQGADNKDLRIAALEGEVSELRGRINEMVLRNDTRPSIEDHRRQSH